jgi:hypothetical protein
MYQQPVKPIHNPRPFRRLIQEPGKRSPCQVRSGWLLDHYVRSDEHEDMIYPKPDSASKAAPHKRFISLTWSLSTIQPFHEITTHIRLESIPRLSRRDNPLFFVCCYEANEEDPNSVSSSLSSSQFFTYYLS